MKKSELEKLVRVKNIALVVDKLSDDEDRYILDIQAVILHFNKLSANGNCIPYLLDTSFKTVSQALVRNITDYDINFNNVHVLNSDNILYIKKTFNDTLSCLFPLPVQLQQPHCQSHCHRIQESTHRTELVFLNTERSYITRLRCSACQSEIPTDDQCSNLIGLFTQV